MLSQSIDSIGLLTLHGCGDLSCTVLRLFANWKSAKTVICVGCCYNKMSQQGIDIQNKEFQFPLSNTLKNLIKSQSDILGNFHRFVELATEAPLVFGHMNEDQLLLRQRQFLFRCILDIALQESMNEVIQQQKQHNQHTWVVRKQTPSVFENFTTYLLPSLERVRIKVGNDFFSPNDFFGENIYSKIKSRTLDTGPHLYEDWKHKGKQLIISLALQYTLSSVCESLIIMDRFLFLEELEGITAAVVPVFDRVVSPRNLAVIGVRST